MAKTAAVILAAGKGTRMVSKRPKVLHQVAGKYLIQHVIEGAQEAGVDQIILVIGAGGEAVQAALGDGFDYAWQREQLGTGHAVLQAMDLLRPEIDRVLVLSGDVPLLQGATMGRLLGEFEEARAKAAVLTAYYQDPTGYGRILRGPAGRITGIVEESDGAPAELAIQEINSGTYCFAKGELAAALQTLKPDNAQGEYYLTDGIRSMSVAGLPVIACVAAAEETLGINNRVQLAEAEALWHRRINEKLMLSGVTIVDPLSTYIDATVAVGQDSVIYPFTILRGQTVIGDDCTVGPNVDLVDCRLGDGVAIRQTVAEQATMGNNCIIGPFSYLRPGAVLGNGVKIGDFVEIKKSVIDDDSKVPHLTYIGDAVIGKSVNIGAGTITCNYDGKNKYQTIIEEGAFVGSNSNLVAPLKLGANAYVAAGSTLTADVPEGSLAVARGRQRVIPDWSGKKR